MVTVGDNPRYEEMSDRAHEDWSGERAGKSITLPLGRGGFNASLALSQLPAP